MRRRIMSAQRTYSYQARNENGDLVTGNIQANSRGHAGKMLVQQGLFVVQLSARYSDGVSARPGVTRSQLADLVWQLATMVESGVGLTESFDCLARQSNDPRVKAFLVDVSRNLREGSSLSDAFSLHSKWVPRSVIAMVKASELTGTLGEVLEQASVYLARDLQIVRRFRTAMAYPVFMLTLCLSVLGFLLAFVIPKFAHVFDTMGGTLPLPTRMLMNLSASVTGNWFYYSGALITIAFGAVIWLRSDPGRRQMDHLATSIPGIAQLVNALHQSRSFRTLALLLNADVPLIESIRVVREVVPSPRYQELWDEVEEQVRVGERFAPPLFDAPFIDESVAHIIDTGDHAGNLGPAMARLTDFMEERYNRSVAAVMRFIEPAMLLLMGAIVCFVALSIMLPMFQAPSMISNR